MLESLLTYVIHGWPLRMLSELDKRYTGADYTVDKNSKDTIKPEQIKPLKDNGAFPLCMRYMQTTLEKTHHLKYNSRLQYGLFLKGMYCLKTFEISVLTLKIFQ